MLKGIPTLLTPDLMKIMMEMGHGDELVIGDSNFPAASCAKRLARCDGHNVPQVLDAILRFFPLDRFVEHPAGLMAVPSGDPAKPTIWEEYLSIIKRYENNFKGFEYIERFAFYERAKNAFAVIATSEASLYANIILKKGVVE